jgi:cobalamin synthase
MGVLLTGTLSLDGFNDTIDGLYVSKEKNLEVMKDPHTGGMGMILTVTFLILKASSVATLGDFYLLPIILMLSRLNAVVAIYLYPYINPNGMATLAKQEFKKSQLFITLFYSIFLTFIFNISILFAISLLILFIIKLFFIKRYGGFSGNIYGFSIEVTELILQNFIILEVL